MFCNKPSLINVSCTLKQSQIGALYTKSVKQIEATVKENLTQRNEVSRIKLWYVVKLFAI